MDAVAAYFAGGPELPSGGTNERENAEKSNQLINEWLNTQQQLYQYAMKEFGLESTEQAQAWLDAFYSHYEQNNNDVNVQGLVDAILAYYQADQAFQAETRRVQTVLNSATAAMTKAADDLPQTLNKEWGAAIESLPAITAPAIAPIPDIIPDDWLERNRAKIDEALEEVYRLESLSQQMVAALDSAATGALSGATRALTECIMGIEGVDASTVLSALMEPFADMAVQLGEMLIAFGLGIDKLEIALGSGQGGIAIAAGVALVALGTAARAGLAAMARGGAGGAGASYGAESVSAEVTDIKTEMTIYVKGRLDGGDLVLSGQKTTNMWAR